MPAALVGIDVLEPNRLADRLVRTPALRFELFTQGEIEYCSRQIEPTEHLAARFCAKEAVAKALGLDGFDPLDVEVESGGESCRVLLHGDALARAESLKVEVAISLTHVRTLAAAVAIALPIRLGNT